MTKVDLMPLYTTYHTAAAAAANTAQPDGYVTSDKQLEALALHPAMCPRSFACVCV